MVAQDVGDRGLAVGYAEHAHRIVVFQVERAVHHDLLARRQSLKDLHRAGPARADADLAAFDRGLAVRACGNEHEIAPVQRHQRLLRHDQGGARVGQPVRRHQQAGPQPAELSGSGAAAVRLATGGDRDGPRRTVKAFHRALCETRVLDPACGTGNFLYVALELMKQLEGEVLAQLDDLGEGEAALEMERFTVGPRPLPDRLPDRTAAIREALDALGVTAELRAIAHTFKGRRIAAIRDALSALVTLGLAESAGDLYALAERRKMRIAVQVGPRAARPGARRHADK